jgi:hypothetical protein
MMGTDVAEQYVHAVAAGERGVEVLAAVKPDAAQDLVPRQAVKDQIQELVASGAAEILEDDLIFAGAREAFRKHAAEFGPVSRAAAEVDQEFTVAEEAAKEIESPKAEGCGPAV